MIIDNTIVFNVYGMHTMIEKKIIDAHIQGGFLVCPFHFYV